MPLIGNPSTSYDPDTQARFRSNLRGNRGSGGGGDSGSNSFWNRRGGGGGK